MAAIRTFTVNDRDIQMQAPTESQILVIARLMRGAKQVDQDNPEEVSLSIMEMSKILDIVDAMIVNPLDRDYLEEQMIKGTLELQSLMDGFQEAVKGEDGEGNRATRRGAAKAAKKVTSRARRS